MKKTKTILFVAVIAVGLTACAKKTSADEVKGTYNGTLTFSGGGSDPNASCNLAKTNDNLVQLILTSALPSSPLDSISVAGTANPYTLTKTGGFTGSVNGNTLIWTYTSLSFTGTK